MGGTGVMGVDNPDNTFINHKRSPNTYIEDLRKDTKGIDDEIKNVTRLGETIEQEQEISVKEKILEIKDAILDTDSHSIIDIAYQLQCMGDSYLHENQYSDAAKCYILSLVAVFDNHDLQQFLSRNYVSYEKIPDLSKKVFGSTDTKLLEAIITETTLQLGKK